MTGPISAPGRRRADLDGFGAFSSTLSTSASAASPTATATEMAMQRSPAEPNAAAARWSAALSRSASGITMAWFFAPPRAWTRLPALVAVSWTYLAIGVEPTKEMPSTSGWVSRPSTASLSP